MVGVIRTVSNILIFDFFGIACLAQHPSIDVKRLRSHAGFLCCNCKSHYFHDFHVSVRMLFWLTLSVTKVVDADGIF